MTVAGVDIQRIDAAVFVGVGICRLVGPNASLDARHEKAGVVDAVLTDAEQEKGFRGTFVWRAFVFQHASDGIPRNQEVAGISIRPSAAFLNQQTGDG